jgi:hypothetical protein
MQWARQALGFIPAPYAVGLRARYYGVGVSSVSASRQPLTRPNREPGLVYTLMHCPKVGCLWVRALEHAMCQFLTQVRLLPTLGSNTATWYAFVRLKSTKYPSRGCLDDCTSTGHDSAKMSDTPLSACHSRNAERVERASREVG